MNQDFLWTEKYRPKTIAETILPDRLKQPFQGFVDQGNIPNLLLTGKSGIGKTTAAIAMCEELDIDYKLINGSLEGREINVLRTTIQDFASTVSIMNRGKRKMVIIDEADYMNAQSVQPALRNFMEQFSKNCGFILTCNYSNRLIDALHSRTTTIHFTVKKGEAVELVKQFYKRTLQILDAEQVEYDKEAVAAVAKKYYPDWRRILNELQTYSATGKIDIGILDAMKKIAIKPLIDALAVKDFTAVRKWVGENNDIEPTDLFTTFYEQAAKIVDKQSIPMLILLLSKYQYQAAFAANQEINTAAFFAEVMADCNVGNV